MSNYDILEFRHDEDKYKRYDRKNGDSKALSEGTNGKNHVPENGTAKIATQNISYPNDDIFFNHEFGCLFSVSSIKHREQYKTDGVAPYVEVVFKCKRKRLYKNSSNLKFLPSQYVIVEVENGVDLGTVSAIGPCAMEKKATCYKNFEPQLSVIRPAARDDVERYFKNREEECHIVQKTKDFSSKFNLEIKITEAEWQLDRQRLTIFFSAPQRVDFRELVKELARTFRTRIELRQISTREEAKRIGGMGPCGRRLCCTSLNNEFCHVTLDHARTQQLSNNVAKLSGYCGRLKCCLLFEYDNYVETFKKYPSLLSKVEIPEGLARILKVDIFKDLVYLYIESKSLYKTISHEELMTLTKKGKVIPPKDEDLRRMSDFDEEYIEDGDFMN